MSAIIARASPIDMASPGSPPDLSSSKSSKSSSSFRSSILSDITAPEIGTHFEDISLHDTKRDSYDLHAHTDGGFLRPHGRTMHSMAGARKKLVPCADNLRSVHLAQRRSNSAGTAHGVLDDKCTNMPVPRMMRPGFRSTSATHAQVSSTKSGDSRSPSPTNRLIHNAPQRATSLVPGSAPHGFLSVQTAGRRRTWAPGRKTVKQLEDEYHDSDEDVPEDAVIWNVPISPAFATASRDRSPHRKSSQSSLSSLKSPGLSKYATSPTTGKSVMPIGLHPSLPRSATTGSFPVEPITDLYSIHERHKSWTNELSDEARNLSAALEAHVTRRSVDHTRESSAQPTSPTQSFTSRRQSSSSAISLPPLQRSNIMIDPLPISKEKEAVLARTRPSWLPPKCQKEERRHLKEWERMMAQSATAERRRAARKLEDMDSVRISHDFAERIWEEQILPNWDVEVSQPRTRDLWWLGIDSKSRGAVWARAIRNELQLTSSSYAAALQRGQTGTEASLLAQMESDAATAFPETGLFAKDGALHLALIDVLVAHAAYRPDLPYKQGLHQMAALLLLNMGAPDAFTCLANILNRPLPLAFATNDAPAVDKWCSLVLAATNISLPALHDHLLSDKVSAPPVPPKDDADTLSESRSRSNGRAKPIQGEEFIAPLLGNLFTAHLDVETASRIWDVYVFEGDAFLVKAWVGVVSRVESGLYGGRDEVLAVLGHQALRSEPWTGLETERVMAGIKDHDRS